MADQGVNSVGIYFDEEAAVNCVSAMAGESVTGYVLVSDVDPASGGIQGFAMSLVSDPAVIPGGITVILPPTGVNSASPPYYQVGFQTPLPVASVIKLLTLSFTCTGGPVQLGLGGNEPCSLYDCFMGFTWANNPGNYTMLQPAANVPWVGLRNTFAVAGVNAGPNCPVEGDGTSWGAVKTLYDR